jgi:hypothetical protein
MLRREIEKSTQGAKHADNYLKFTVEAGEAFIKLFEYSATEYKNNTE